MTLPGGFPTIRPEERKRLTYSVSEMIDRPMILRVFVGNGTMRSLGWQWHKPRLFSSGHRLRFSRSKTWLQGLENTHLALEVHLWLHQFDISCQHAVLLTSLTAIRLES